MFLYTFQCAVGKQWPVIPRADIAGVILYSAASIASTLSMYISATLLPVSTNQCIIQTVNIISGIFLFYLLLKEIPTMLLVGSAVMCICGVVLVVQPNFFFGYVKHFGQVSGHKKMWKQFKLPSDSHNCCLKKHKLTKSKTFFK